MHGVSHQPTLWRLVLSQPRAFAGATAWSVTNTFFDFLPEVMVGLAVDSAVQGQKSLLGSMGIVDPWHQILLITAAAFLAWGVESWSQYRYMIAWRSLAQNLQHQLRQRLARHVLGMRMDVFERRSTADLTTVMNDDVNQIERFISDGIHSILSLIVGFCLVFAFFATMSPVAAMLAVLPAPLVVIISRLYRRRIDSRFLSLRRYSGAISDAISNGLRGFMTIRAFGQADWEVERISRQSATYRQAAIAAARLSAGYVPVLRMAIVFGFAGVLLYGGHLAVSGEIAVAAYGTLVFLTQRLLWPMASMALLVEGYQKMQASLVRIGELLALDIHCPISKMPDRNHEGGPVLIIDDLTFGYEKSNPLWTLNLNVSAGERVAVVGRSGSGKSTLLKIILGFYEPTVGQVIVSHHGKPAAGASGISYVGQHPYMFSGSIADNLRYGNLTATDEELVAVCKALGLHDFISALPDGYRSALGEDGCLLSGGQRQRLAIGRALLRQSSVLLMDEPTSALDRDSAQRVFEALRRHCQDRAVIVVTHRADEHCEFDRVVDVSA